MPFTLVTESHPRGALWQPEHWKAGFIDNRGRFRVYRPDYPNAWSSGHALRAHVVWWINTGELVPLGNEYELHHKNEDRLDDRFENLELLTNSEHQIRHKRKNINRRCPTCESWFVVPPHKPDKKYCDLQCYHGDLTVRAKRNANISISLKRAYAEGRR